MDARRSPLTSKAKKLVRPCGVTLYHNYYYRVSSLEVTG